MFINELSFQNKQTDWNIQNLSFDRFNLLVGASGVGKTQILRAIRAISSLALVGQHSVPIKFKFKFLTNGVQYEWELESSLSESSINNSIINPNSSNIIIKQEKLVSSSAGVLFDRDQDKFLFKGKELPQLNRTETAIKLLGESPIPIIRDALVSGILDDHPYQASEPIDDQLNSLIETIQSYEKWREFPMLSPQIKAFLLQAKGSDQFKLLKDIFKEIFPSVEDVSVELTSKQSTQPQRTSRQLQFKIKEYGIQHWVSAPDISSGMLRTLIHLVDLMLAPSGSVVLIDEFENSLGVNCMGPLTDFILSRAAELQFIITSHHPYIISQIPKTHWKVVRRHGSTVKVTPASEVRALQGSSAQDDFTRLINSPEFEEGIA